jgi:hypothetical protein
MHTDDDANPTGPRNRSRLRFELIFGSVWLGVGLFLLPAIIYTVGTLLLGVYRQGSGLPRFYLDFFSDLAEPSGRAWILALGPLLLITALRVVFIGAGKRSDDEDDTSHQPPRRAKPETVRVEPKIGAG